MGSQSESCSDKYGLDHPHINDIFLRCAQTGSMFTEARKPSH